MTSPSPNRDNSLQEKLAEVVFGDLSHMATDSRQLYREKNKYKIDEIQALIATETQKARIDEHSVLWEIVPTEAEHIGTVKDISDLRVTKLSASLPQTEGELQSTPVLRDGEDG